MAVRMQELAVLASDPLLPTHDRYGMDAEFGLLTEWEPPRNADRYNGVAVMTGTDLRNQDGRRRRAADMTITVDDWRPDQNVATELVWPRTQSQLVQQ